MGIKTPPETAGPGSLLPMSPVEFSLDLSQHPCGRCDLGELAFCAGLRNDEVTQLIAILNQQHVEAQDTIFREGDPPSHLFSVSAGVVKLYKLLADGRRQITSFLFPGDFFGLSRDGGYVYTAEALTGVTLCRFPRKKLDDLMGVLPRLEQRMLDLAIQELTSAHEQMLLLGRKTAKEKVASLLMLLSRKNIQMGLPPEKLALPMSRGDMADYLGLTIETVSRVLTQMRREGSLDLIGNSHITVIQPDVIQALSEGNAP